MTYSPLGISKDYKLKTFEFSDSAASSTSLSEASSADHPKWLHLVLGSGCYVIVTNFNV